MVAADRRAPGRDVPVLVSYLAELETVHRDDIDTVS
jgi:hypothetical protein